LIVACSSLGWWKFENILNGSKTQKVWDLRTPAVGGPIARYMVNWLNNISSEIIQIIRIRFFWKVLFNCSFQNSEVAHWKFKIRINSKQRKFRFIVEHKNFYWKKFVWNWKP
jgi:hypothetical protein